MKVLYYNWVDYEDAQKRGGGVSLYQRNLIDAAVAAGDEVAFLSSGTSHPLIPWHPYIRTMKARDRRVRKFEIFNSPILSPGGYSFTEDMAQNPRLDQLFADFLRRNGPFDVVHFNNLEGIPVSFLEVVRKQTPHAKIIVSLHNYFAFCPQVNLWFQERANCGDYKEGRKCVNCIPVTAVPAHARKDYIIDTFLQRTGIARRPILNHFALVLLYDFVKPVLRRVKLIRRFVKKGRAAETPAVTSFLDKARADQFVNRRNAYLTAINKYADHVLAVSERVAQLAIQHGIQPHRVQTAYIGSRFAGISSVKRAPAWDGKTPLSIAYLGYMRRDKGYYFLLQAFEKMPPALADRLAITIAAKATDPEAVQRMKRIAHKFQAFHLVDGYTHASLPDVLAGVDLGIVPVLWEDNLPQVAIEMVGSGVPILTSDLGGASELMHNPKLTFRAGSFADLYAKLRGILDRPELLQQAMRDRSTLLTVEQHYRSLKTEFYGEKSGTEVVEHAAA